MRPLWTRKSRRPRPIAAKRLMRCEQLEDRSLLAIAAFTVNLYEDAGGVPGQLISDDAVQVGETFFVEIMAREYDPLAAGLGGVALDIAWDPNVLQEIDVPFQPSDSSSPLVTQAFPLFRDGKLDNQAGTIDNLSGYAFLAGGAGRAIGNLAPERFSLLQFRALRPAEESRLSMSQGRTSIATVPVSSLSSANLYFEPQTITVVASDTATPVVETSVAKVDFGPLFVGPLPAYVYFKTFQNQPSVPSLQVSHVEVGDDRACWPTERVTTSFITVPAIHGLDRAAQKTRSVWPGPEPTLPSPTAAVPIPSAAPGSDHPTSNATSGESAAAIDSVFASDESVALLDEFEKSFDRVAEGWFAPK